MVVPNLGNQAVPNWEILQSTATEAAIRIIRVKAGTHFSHVMQRISMIDTDISFIFINYLDAFATTLQAEQERLLRSSLTENVVYTNPGVEGSGIHNLLRHIEGFQKKFPGGCFRMNWLRQQHGQALAEWTQLNQDGSELVTGHSFARLGEDGRIAHLAGFWSPGSV